MRPYAQDHRSNKRRKTTHIHPANLKDATKNEGCDMGETSYLHMLTVENISNQFFSANLLIKFYVNIGLCYIAIRRLMSGEKLQFPLKNSPRF